MSPEQMLLFVLPAYNEERALPGLLDRIQRAMQEEGSDYRILLVDDGSTDSTAEVARHWSSKVPLRLVSHPVNRGLGAALRSGLKEACREAPPNSLLVTMDADNTHDPAAAVAMGKLAQVGCDLVIASRYGPGGGEIGVSPLRRLFSHGACSLLRTLFPLSGVRDYSSGFRLYRIEIVKSGLQRWGDAFIEEAGFTCMAEVLLKLRRLGARVREISVPLRYDLKQGASKLRPAYTIVRYLILVCRELARAGASRLSSEAPESPQQAPEVGSAETVKF